LRRTIKTWDRWRPWLIATHVLLFVVFLALSCGIAANLDALWPVNPGQAWVGFLSGIVSGAAVGIVGHKIAYGLAWVITTHRNERMLLRYYDAVKTMAVAESE
jgi:hypothetical protein